MALRPAFVRLRERPVLLLGGAAVAALEAVTVLALVAFAPSGFSVPIIAAVAVVVAGGLGTVAAAPLDAYARGHPAAVADDPRALGVALGRHLAGLALAPLGVAVAASAYLVGATAFDLARYAVNPLARGVPGLGLLLLTGYAVAFVGVSLARLPFERAREGTVGGALRASAATTLARPGTAFRGWCERGLVAAPWVAWAALGFVAVVPRSIPPSGLTIFAGIYVGLRAVGVAFSSAHRATIDFGDVETPDSAAVGRVALACLLVVGLGVGAGAVRVAELRPYAAPEPAPLDGATPNEAVRSADRAFDHANFAARSLTYNVSNGSREVFRTRTVADYRDHEIRVTFAAGRDLTDPTNGPLESYLSDGTIANRIRPEGEWIVQQQPGYVEGVDGVTPTGAVRPGSAWRVVERTDGRLTVRANGSAAVEELVVSRGSLDSEWAGVTATFDRDTGRLQRVVTRTERRGGVRLRHVATFRYGVGAERPAGVGDPGAVSLLWDAAVY